MSEKIIDPIYQTATYFSHIVKRINSSISLEEIALHTANIVSTAKSSFLFPENVREAIDNLYKTTSAINSSYTINFNVHDFVAQLQQNSQINTSSTSEESRIIIENIALSAINHDFTTIAKTILQNDSTQITNSKKSNENIDLSQRSVTFESQGVKKQLSFSDFIAFFTLLITIIFQFLPDATVQELEQQNILLEQEYELSVQQTELLKQQNEALIEIINSTHSEDETIAASLEDIKDSLQAIEDALETTDYSVESSDSAPESELSVSSEGQTDDKD